MHLTNLNLMLKAIYHSLTERKRTGKKSFAVLIDPDKVNDSNMEQLIDLSVSARVDYFLVGGSLVISTYLDECLQLIKRSCQIPTLLFPGSPSQVSKYADALLYLSLISGRNAELLIGQHVVSAPFVKNSGLEIMPTGYMVVDGGAPHRLYISKARPFTADKPKLQCVQLWPRNAGYAVFYRMRVAALKRPITESMIEKEAQSISCP